MFYLNDNKKINKCFKCGLCRYQCPVYSVHRNDNYSPKGKLLATGYQQKNAKALLDLVDIYRECTQCKHCLKTCPGDIDIPEMVIEYRGKLNKILPDKTYERLLKNIKELGTPYTSVEKNGFHKNEKNKTDILLFLGCTARYKLPEIAKSTISFLDRIGLDYTILDNESCCGNILYNTGYLDDAKDVAKRNVTSLNKYKKIITLCPGCYNMLNIYKKLTRTKYEVFHIVEIINAIREKIKTNEEPVYFHVPCHLYNTGEFNESFFNIISLFENASSSLDVTNSTRCCGAGGGMLSTNEEFVKERMNITFGDIKGDTVITSCPFCYMSFKKYSSKNVVYITEKLNFDDVFKIDVRSLSKTKNQKNIVEVELNSRSFIKWTLMYKLKHIIKVK